MHTDCKKPPTAPIEESQPTEGSPIDDSTHRLSGGCHSINMAHVCHGCGHALADSLAFLEFPFSLCLLFSPVHPSVRPSVCVCVCVCVGFGFLPGTLPAPPWLRLIHLTCPACTSAFHQLINSTVYLLRCSIHSLPDICFNYSGSLSLSVTLQ